MTALQSFIISPVVGAVIGYFTNWLAIKMLFRPREEKRLWGFRLPFTPGLIPKERAVLTRKVAATVGEKLLTTETLTKELTSEKTSRAVEKTIDDLLLRLGDETAETLLRRFGFFCHSENANAQSTADWLFENIWGSFRRHSQDFFLGDGLNELLQTVQSQVKEKYFSDGKTVREILPAQTEDAARNFLREHLAGAVKFMLKIWDENPTIDEQLSKQLRRVIDENLGRVIGFFLNSDSIYKNIKAELSIFVSNEDNQKLFANNFESLLGGWLDKDAGTAVKIIGDTLVKYEITQTSDWEGWIAALQESAANAWPNWENYLRDRLYNAVSSWLTKILNTRIKTLPDRLGEDRLASGKALLMRAVRAAIAKGAVLIAQNMDIRQMVEDKINALNVQEAEEIVVSVVKRELNAITILGGALGFIIGLAPGIINLL